MNAVGINVSKRKNTATIRRSGDIVVMDPCDIPHTKPSINELIDIIKGLDGETKVCMEHTGRYYEPMVSWLPSADIFVRAINPILIKNFGSEGLRDTKTDKSGWILSTAISMWTVSVPNHRMFSLLNTASRTVESL